MRGMIGNSIFQEKNYCCLHAELSIITKGQYGNYTKQPDDLLVPPPSFLQDEDQSFLQ